ncbi:hypothetical protein PR048_023060 [Dryococelus australis]|uniref:Uncharacterized protein n=1 Tax=Dryococelus australis TaxID=614101 RepID=A0ABQ9GT03_9NEOP|nr:hypothetical protein PR048_023060 [Dryococelus australis]
MAQKQEKYYEYQRVADDTTAREHSEETPPTSDDVREHRASPPPSPAGIEPASPWRKAQGSSHPTTAAPGDVLGGRGCRLARADLPPQVSELAGSLETPPRSPAIWSTPGGEPGFPQSASPSTPRSTPLFSSLDSCVIHNAALAVPTPCCLYHPLSTVLCGNTLSMFGDPNLRGLVFVHFCSSLMMPCRELYVPSSPWTLLLSIRARENPPVIGMVRHDSHVLKSGSDPAGNRNRFAMGPASREVSPERLTDARTISGDYGLRPSCVGATPAVVDARACRKRGNEDVSLPSAPGESLHRDGKRERMEVKRRARYSSGMEHALFWGLQDCSACGITPLLPSPKPYVFVSTPYPHGHPFNPPEETGSQIIFKRRASIGKSTGRRNLRNCGFPSSGEQRRRHFFRLQSNARTTRPGEWEVERHLGSIFYFVTSALSLRSPSTSVAAPRRRAVNIAGDLCVGSREVTPACPRPARLHHAQVCTPTETLLIIIILGSFHRMTPLKEAPCDMSVTERWNGDNKIPRVGAAVTRWVDHLPPTKADWDQIRGGSRTDSRTWDSCRTMSLAGAGFLGCLPFPPSLHSDAAPYPPRFNLFGSHDLVCTCVLLAYQEGKSTQVGWLRVRTSSNRKQMAHCLHKRSSLRATTPCRIPHWTQFSEHEVPHHGQIMESASSSGRISAAFLHWLLHSCEATPVLTELLAIGAHNCDAFIYWRRVSQGASREVCSNDKLIAKVHVFQV